MLLPEQVIRDLVSRGELWESAPGLCGMRGPLAALTASVSMTLRDLAMTETRDEWRMPNGVAFETLERADYFESFPQWLTAASHLSGDEEALARVARSSSPGDAARRSFEPAAAALPPAVCYHTYAALRGTCVEDSMVMTAEETCWRHEGTRMSPLERGWAFTMREIVFLGTSFETEDFRQRGIERTVELADSLGLRARIAVASDPFFAPTSRGKAVLQRVKSLKHELKVDCGDGHSLAIASFNNHERFFGEAFDITLPTGAPACSACVAFGIERWVLAILMTHGVDDSAWPTMNADVAAAGAAR